MDRKCENCAMSKTEQGSSICYDCLVNGGKRYFIASRGNGKWNACMEQMKRELEAIEKRGPRRLFGDITSGYTYMDSDFIKTIGVIMDSKALKETLNKVYGLNKEEREMDYQSYYKAGYFKERIEIKDVIFNGPATIVLWTDGTKTIVKCEGEHFDKEKGLAMAIAKKFLGTNESKSNYNDIFKKYCPEEGVVEPVKEKKIVKDKKKVVVDMTLGEYAKMKNKPASTLRKHFEKGLFSKAYKVGNKWYIKVTKWVEED